MANVRALRTQTVFGRVARLRLFSFDRCPVVVVVAGAIFFAVRAACVWLVRACKHRLRVCFGTNLWMVFRVRSRRQTSGDERSMFSRAVVFFVFASRAT